ncbi:ProQ/FINO family protein [Parendozoicomonas sp. Alg238-R29]|uniref:ProQ/FINO family protein n=1 Tax=Parendozoicomonas sp. Alg238-R29 TaxID=2993446 RepID=UPI00248E2DBC|nr:ProQ/FINO family protein [Parendozoicomonas sp. Alg238-R29]
MQSANQPESKDGQSPEVKTTSDEVSRLLAELSSRNIKDVMGHEALRVLRLLWPAVFRVSSPRPLKVGIDKDIAATGKVPQPLIKIGLRCYTRLDQYLESTRDGRARIGLDAKPHGKVRLEEAVNADMMLYDRFCKRTPRRAFVGQLRVVTEQEKTELAH